MKINQNIKPEIRQSLRMVFPDEEVERLNVEVKKLVSPDFKINLGVFELGTKIENEKFLSTTSWIDKVEILEEFLINNCDGANYYIVFDELDEDYKTVKETGNIDTGYIPLLTGLLKAVQNVKSIFSNPRFKIKPIVFLRSDIYDLIKDADKNKWSDYRIDIDWDNEKLKKLVAHRILQDCQEPIPDKSFDILWHKIFNKKDQIHYGDAKNKTTDIFDFMSRSTLLRPRDIISYVRSCCELAVELKRNEIDEDIVWQQDRAFSNYLKAEISDEIYPILPDIDAIFNVLSSIRKWNFKPSEFKNEYRKFYDRGQVSESDVDFVLETLFNYSVIGNQHKTKDKFLFFKYMHTNMTFNRNENIVIHRGLFKALQIV